MSHKEDYKPTGSHLAGSPSRTIVYPFGRYQIKVALGPNNEFRGIVEIRVARDFLSVEQRIASTGNIDVEEFYPKE